MSARVLPSLNRPANALSPSCAARKTSSNGSLLWRISKRWSNQRCTAFYRRQSSGRSGGGSRIETLAKIPMIMCDLPKVPLRDKKGLVGNPPHWQSRYFRGGAPHDSYHHQVSESGRPGRPGGGTYPPQGHTLGGRPPRFSPARHSSVIFQAGGLRGELQALRTGFPDDL